MRWFSGRKRFPFGVLLSRRIAGGRRHFVDGNLLTINQMKVGQTGKVVRLDGGRGFIRRLEALGIRPGGRVTKVNSMLFRGPIVLKVGSGQVAVGFGMANRIWVEPDKPS